MDDYLLEDGTVNFLPTRLNRQPIVVRGLTADELWITVGVTGVLGLILGIIAAVLIGQVGMVPTGVILSIAIGIFLGGSMLRRKKRGRPDTWLYRQMQWYMRCQHPLLGSFLGGNYLITQSGLWEIRRLSQPLTGKPSRDPKRRPNNPGQNRKGRKS